MPVPPPIPQKKGSPLLKIILIISVTSLVLMIAGVVAYRSIIASGITRTFDDQFGDQHLKTAVALIEMHNVRYGKYPDSLKDLKFTGGWDQLALQSVRYVPSPTRDAYYIEVERGWVGKPDLAMPPEFWKGTGYSASLKPAK
jgi:hypothetical protein